MWLTDGRPNPGTKPAEASHPSEASRSRRVAEADEGEVFDIDAIPQSADDYARHIGDADEHMRELLSGAVGEGEGDVEDGAKEGDDVVDGFADAVRLMPHQVRGVKWMRGRESGQKKGGILADVCDLLYSACRADQSQDMGLGKTVQTLARIVEGVATAAERKAGYTGGTLYV